MNEVFATEGRVGKGTVFSEPAVKAEMLSLRRAGYSYIQIARKYGVDHSTIVYHCKKAGLLLFTDKWLLGEMLDKVRAGVDIDSVAILYGCSRTVIESYCHRAGITGIEVSKNQDSLPPLTPDLPELGEVPVLILTKKTEVVRPGWRLDERGEWICLGPNKESDKERKEIKERNHRALEKRRLEMLTY
jgi:hypothetical protein